jgi:hypothetical protein
VIRSSASRWLTAVHAGCWTLVFGVLARAAPAAPHVLVEGPSGDPIVERLVSELTASGFVVTTSPATLAGPPLAADDRDAVARVVSSRAIEIWSIDHARKTATELTVFSVGASNDADRAVAAVQAAELVRAHLLPVTAASAPVASAVTAASAPVGSNSVPVASNAAPVASNAAPMASNAAPVRRAAPEAILVPPLDRVTPAAPPAAAPSPAPSSPASSSPAPLPPDRAHFGLDAGPLILFGASGVPASANLVLMPRWMPTGQLIVRTAITVPLASFDVTASAGHASVSEWLLGASVDWNLLPSEWPWECLVGAGSAAARIATQGVATPPYVSSSGNAWTWVPFVEAGLTRRLWSPQIRLGLLAILGAAAPEVQIHFAGQNIATWGRPLAGMALTLQVEAL